jgi:hypothetical protein
MTDNDDDTDTGNDDNTDIKFYHCTNLVLVESLIYLW